jgi:hypothetical protein
MALIALFALVWFSVGLVTVIWLELGSGKRTFTVRDAVDCLGAACFGPLLTLFALFEWINSLRHVILFNRRRWR